ncbi:nucleus protein [Rhodotorula toruloides]|uniref:Nucleus protein n=1 Tax=Rhodotorula toruloides TaxID=5286 RepID=A0A511KP82_RHOTO|nr:nucleus protein [Rhodotorula toruloides]
MDFYHRSALILDALDAKKGSVKGLCMSEATKSRKPGEGARFLKVVVEVLKYRPHILHLLTATKLLAQEPTLFVPPSSIAAASAAIKSGVAASASKALKQPKKYQKQAPTPLNLASVMVHDLMFAKRGLTLPKEHKVRKKLEKYKPALDKENEREKRRRKVATNEGLQIALPEKIASSLSSIGKGKKREHDADRFAEEAGAGLEAVGEIRWMRVNTLRWSVEQAVEWFEKGGWEMFEDVEEMLAAAQAKPKVFALDAHIEPLLALPASVSLPTMSAYQDGRLLAQDKASCMPAWVLLAPVLADAEEALANGLDAGEGEEKKRGKGLRVLDATAAPGNKTTMAAALVAGEPINGKVTACERDQGRFKVLKDMLKRADAKNVQPMNVDFLSLKPDDPKLKNVSHLLVDPSCSGSGIPSRLDHLVPSAPEEEQLSRIRSLSNFQIAILSHALRFVGAKRVVYSTCSIWEQEDEGVVMRVLGKKEFREMGWRLAPRDEVLPTWERRGRVEACGGDKNIADSLVRCLPEDGTNGFFVACFVKDEYAEPIPAPPTVAQPTRAAEAVEVEAGDGENVAAAPSNNKQGGKQAKKAKSSVSRVARIAKEEVVGKAPEPTPLAAKETGVGAKKADKKLSKKQLYLLKKEELKRKKAAQE